MAGTILVTYRDLLDHCLDYFGADAGQEALRMARRSVQDAYRTVTNLRRWTYFYQRGRLVSVRPYNTGTIQYLATTGSYARQLILTGGTWPAWAASGQILIGQVIFQVSQRVDDHNLQLDSATDPGVDYPAGTLYYLFQDTYPLPTDFLAADEFLNIGNQAVLVYEHPRAWLSYQRIVATPATPRVYTFRSDPKYFGALAVSFYPPPDNQYTFDYMYNRRPRTLLLDEYATGTVTTAASSALVSGNGTTWTSRMVGAVMNFSADSLTKPTGQGGANPFYCQRVVIACNSATSLTLDAVLTETLTGVKYAISDPADIEDGAMLTYLYREIEHQARCNRRMKPTVAEEEHYQQAVFTAMEADSRTFGPRSAGDHNIVRRRLAHMPSGPDVS